MIGKLTETPVTTVRVDWVCECGGKMVATGECLASYPAQYPHGCDKCHTRENSKKLYPRIEHREPSAEGELFSEQVKRVAHELAVGNENWDIPEAEDCRKAREMVLDERLGRAAVKK